MTSSMQHIGFQVNCPGSTHPWPRLTPSVINRIALIDRAIRSSGFRLFMYSPSEIREDTGAIAGFLHDEGELRMAEAPLPRINANWTRRTKRNLNRGMGYEKFQGWMASRGAEVFLPYRISDVLSNKQRAFRLVYEYDPALHPHTEVYRGSLAQLDFFIGSGPLTFLKPRGGSRGDGLIVIQHQRDGLGISYYEKGRRRLDVASDVEKAHEVVERLVPRSKRMVIQRGIDTHKFDGRTFDVRVIMLNDGRRWHCLHEARLSRQRSRVSNVAQGGRSVVTEELLIETLGPQTTDQILSEIQSESFGLAAHLERRFPGQLNEFALDFVIDKQGRPWLIETNTKPGMPSVGSEVTVFNASREHAYAFDRWVYPHCEILAEFLLRKARSAQGGDSQSLVPGRTDQPTPSGIRARLGVETLRHRVHPGPQQLAASEAPNQREHQP